MPAQTLPQPDVLIAGAGIIGLTLALELEARGATVVVLDSNSAFRQTSFAAAGMLAAYDKQNPLDLLPLATQSLQLYPQFLQRVEALSHKRVPFQTQMTLEYARGEVQFTLAEQSLDPRQLSDALLAAVGSTSIALQQNTGAVDTTETLHGLRVCTASGLEFSPRAVVHANGAWFTDPSRDRQIILPRKGQMLRVQLPHSLRLTEVLRSEDVYIVPRTLGPQAGTALIGATVEDAGFDLTVHTDDLARLRAKSAKMLPVLADSTATPQVEAWAGIRPATIDGLPLLGRHPAGGRQWVATGHFRNGILLAPATAQVMADLIEGKESAVDLAAFSPQRF